MENLFVGNLKVRSKRMIKGVLLALPGGDACIERLKRLRDRCTGFMNSCPSSRDLNDARKNLRIEMEKRFDRFMAGDKNLLLPCAETPRVSVVIVVWNQAPLTLACLQSLAREMYVPLEVIVVDNASTDGTEELLGRVGGVRVVTNDQNIGFLKAVNQGMRHARGEYALLLNNDAVPRPDSLTAAINILDTDDTVGAVGGRLVLPNGLLQEAGSIVWRDGSCLGYGCGMNPEAGEAMFRRDVDYCSGAFLLLRRVLFEALGGFDEVFAPAYYEEADFCMRLWESGRRVVYEPRAIVDHFEFGSLEKTASAIELQIRNRSVFAAKHAEALRHRWEPSPRAVLHARMRDSGRSRVLAIDDRVPLHSLGSGFPRARQLIVEMVEAGCFVTLYPLQTPVEDWNRTYRSLPREVETAMGHGLSGLEKFLAERRGYYHILFVSRPHNMKSVVRLHERHPELFEGLRIIYDAEAVFAARDLNKARVMNDPAARKRAEAQIVREVELARMAHAVTTVSEKEAKYFHSTSGAHVHVLGHSLISSPTPSSFSSRRDILFVGALDDEDSPNVDSLVWFVKEAWPCLSPSLEPGASLVVVGRNGAPGVQALAGSGIHLVGRVDSLDSYYDRARVFIAPTRYAGGIPHKVHEAAAYGVPVVTTSLLADQLGWHDGVELLMADSPEAFAARVGELYRNPDLWEAVRSAALERVGRDCDPEVFRRELRKLLSGMGEPDGKGRLPHRELG